MRWLVFVISAMGLLALQMGLALVPRIGEARPDVLLLLVIFVALFSGGIAVPLYAALLAGLLQDVASGTFGPFMFGYGLVGLMMLRLRLAVYRDHPLAHIACGLASVLVMLGWLHVLMPMMRWVVRLVIFRSEDASAWPDLRPPLVSWVVTVLMAPLVLVMLKKLRKAMGLRVVE